MVSDFHLNRWSKPSGEEGSAQSVLIVRSVNESICECLVAGGAVVVAPVVVIWVIVAVSSCTRETDDCAQQQCS